MKKSAKIFLLTLAALAFVFGAVSLFTHAKKIGEPPVEKKPPPEMVDVIKPESLAWRRASSTVPWAARDSHEVFVFRGKLWLTSGLDAEDTKINNEPQYEMAKYFNDIWSSADGINWTLAKEHAEFPPIRSDSIKFFNNSLYMIGGWSPDEDIGYKNGIWKSNDAVHWEQIAKSADFGEREGQKIVEFNGKLWLIGGVNYYIRKTMNDVWSSDDAVHWKLVTASAPWHSRWDHDLVVFDNKIWLMGGMDFGDTGFSDVWYSSDGKNWFLATSTAPWGKRQGHGSVVFGGKMWLISGLDAVTTEGFSDAWYSENGVDWNKTKVDGSWIGREDHTAVVFKDKIWILGGMDGNFHWNNDVWYSEFKTKKVAK